LQAPESPRVFPQPAHILRAYRTLRRRSGFSNCDSADSRSTIERSPNDDPQLQPARAKPCSGLRFNRSAARTAPVAARPAAEAVAGRRPRAARKAFARSHRGPRARPGSARRQGPGDRAPDPRSRARCGKNHLEELSGASATHASERAAVAQLHEEIRGALRRAAPTLAQPLLKEALASERLTAAQERRIVERLRLSGG
jgi:hypothetical protein